MKLAVRYLRQKASGFILFRLFFPISSLPITFFVLVFVFFFLKIGGEKFLRFRGLHSDVNTLMLVRLSQMIISHEKN